MAYLYDFADGWEHRVTLESIAPLAPGAREPVCLGGARGCPPEDVGGIRGHQLADWLRAGAPAGDVPEPFEDAEQAHEWLPLGYNPDAFDAAEATAAMRAWASGERLPWHGLPVPLVDLLQGMRGQGWWRASAWLTALGERLAVVLDEQDLRRASRPWLAVLDAVGAGAQLTAAGYLPPLVVQQIARSSGIAEWWIGKANREDLTPPDAGARSANAGTYVAAAKDSVIGLSWTPLHDPAFKAANATGFGPPASPGGWWSSPGWCEPALLSG
ncbi:plasmid pRiA4b ORF-3 family protein [Lapillicoccus sp.]|uniref:plasmid pRiA4b ORF-3 family protein n=1 Tax=Lapillicoccus sp. TaxID=1909287 RepID=UPI003265FD6C